MEAIDEDCEANFVPTARPLGDLNKQKKGEKFGGTRHRRLPTSPRNVSRHHQQMASQKRKTDMAPLQRMPQLGPFVLAPFAPRVVHPTKKRAGSSAFLAVAM